MELPACLPGSESPSLTSGITTTFTSQPSPLKMADLISTTIAETFSIMNLMAYIEEHNAAPTPLMLLRLITTNSWTLRKDWQSCNGLYRVLNDLHTRQRFKELHLVYLPDAELAVFCGREPPGDGEYPGDKTEMSCPVVDGDAAAGADSTVLPETGYSQLPVLEEAKRGSMVFVLPGSFLTAVVTGLLRTSLERILEKVAGVMERCCNRERPLPGWTLAVTDGDQVCYYVERMITMEQLTAGRTMSHEREIETIFGKNRVFNRRRIDLRKLQKQERDRLSEEMEKAAAQKRLEDEACEAQADPEGDDMLVEEDAEVSDVDVWSDEEHEALDS